MKYLFLAALLLAGCSTAQQAKVKTGVSVACANVAAIQQLMPWIVGFASVSPAVAADLTIANAAANGACMSAPAVEALVNKINADINAAKAVGGK